MEKFWMIIAIFVVGGIWYIGVCCEDISIALKEKK